MAAGAMCSKCGQAPRSRTHAWCRACRSAWQLARYHVRMAEEPAFRARTRASKQRQYARRHRHVAPRRTSGRLRQHTLPAGELWCWFCQEGHVHAAFSPRPTRRGYDHSCREGKAILARLWRATRARGDAGLHAARAQAPDAHA